MPNPEKEKEDPIVSVYWRDEILQVMYWMKGEGFGQEITVSTLAKFLNAEDEALRLNLELMVTSDLLERSGNETYVLTPEGAKEGGRRFADEFETMLKPGHFECNEPDCDCHNPDSIEALCKHFVSSQKPEQDSLN